MNTIKKQRSWELLNEDWMAVITGFVIITLTILIYQWVPSLPDLFKPKDSWSGSDFLSGFLSKPNLLRIVYIFVFFALLSWLGLKFAGKRTNRFLGSFAVIALLAILAQVISTHTSIKAVSLETVFFSILIGLLISNTMKLPEWLKQSVQSEFYIKIGLVLLGTSVLFSNIMKAGSLGLIQALLVVISVWYIAFWIARKMKIDSEMSTMLASAVSICGVSAAIATCGAIKGDNKKLSYVISLVLIVAIPMMIFMPYLAKLSKEGFYFPNGVQGFTATIGSFFATATSIHKACFDEKTKTLTSDEMNGYFGCLSRILGPEYVHYFGQAYRQNYNDFIYFMGNQGYISMSYYDFKARLEKKQLLDVADDVQGIFDGYFLDECAEILVASSQKYTAHFVTVTSHSPWTVPKTFPAPFAEPYLTAFAYVDHCIQSFMERLMSQPERFAKTLVVIVADHTSVVFSNDLWERIRIPIIFYNPQFATFPKPDHCLNIYASHVDVMPTVIALLGGDLPYAGLGKNLLDPASVKIGAVGGSRTDGFYVKDKFLLQYSPWDKEAQLFILHEGRCELKDKSEEYPGIKQEMMLEYLAQYESARRLASQNLIFPREKK